MLAVRFTLGLLVTLPIDKPLPHGLMFRAAQGRRWCRLHFRQFWKRIRAILFFNISKCTQRIRAAAGEERAWGLKMAAARSGCLTLTTEHRIFFRTEPR